MKFLKTNLVSPAWRKKISKLKRRILKHVVLIRIALISAAVLAVAAIGLFIHQSRIGSFVTPATNFIFTSNAEIKSEKGKTNILILGKGGEGHDAPDLTDTIILASISKTNNNITLISLPRDIYLVDKQLKINHAFLQGRDQGGTVQGLENAKKVISTVTGQPIHYALVLDFSAFTKFIDTLGGIEVNVERSFTDSEYPIAGRENDLCGGDKTYKCRYETVSFEQGTQTMNGETALKFARSRHSSNPLEGSDFARAARQQKVIEGVKNKILSTGVVFNPDMISRLITVGEDSVITDMTIDQGAVLARMAFDARDNIKNYVLGEDLLYEPPISPYRYFGQFVLLPKGASFEAIHRWVNSVL